MKHIGRYLIILIIVITLWNTWLIKPLKVFTVFLHELGHTVMAFIFGSGIQGFKVSLNESGSTLVQSKGWFSTFMIANGGYLGSIFFSLLILCLKRTVFRKYILGTLATILLTICIKFSEDFQTLLFVVVFTLVVLFLYMQQNEKIYDLAVDIIGITGAAYAVYDTFVDTILFQINLKFHIINGWDGKTPLTDAMQLAKMTPIPAMIWGILWLGIALFAIYITLLKSPKSGRNKSKSIKA